MVQFSWSIVKWKKLDTVRVTKICSKQHSDQGVPEKTRCFTSEGWRYWHFKADLLEELQAIDNFEKVTVLVKAISTNPPDTMNDIPHQYVSLYWVDAISPQIDSHSISVVSNENIHKLTIVQLHSEREHDKTRLLHWNCPWYRNHCWSYTRRGRNHHR